MYGEGLLKGLRVTFRHFFGKAITEQYPERRPKLPPRSHGSFKLNTEKCSACGTCALSCPNNVISVESFRDENKKRHLSGFRMELMYCLFCGLCVESCPSSALKFTDDFELSCYSRDGMVLTLANNPPAVEEKKSE
ncbi:NuoI/complex I 23 kDa subunit family protein [Zhaonella formicivorans]|uniref:NuoI/complex I 23 kDa subunit family protein n=1 Tax=Zhaonella formicivorans TaxID=2528593 RepID=UPI0010E39A14|nr:NADH-quinone oxidoreductase subunit I [Zhaonella formicivorans]